MSEEELATVADLLADETARAILTATSEQPMAASTLSEQLAASGPTIYRRLDRLEAADLVVERTEPDVEGGHHRTVYEPNLRRVRIDLADGEFSIEVTREDMADRFTSIVEGI